jgi:hypothetical protein
MIELRPHRWKSNMNSSVEADQLGVADFHELEMAADDGGAERLGLDTGE